jgi:hypothetical protein
MFFWRFFTARRPLFAAIFAIGIIGLAGVLFAMPSTLQNWLRPSHADLVVAEDQSRPAFPLAIALNKRYLIDAENKPFLMHGDTAWSLITDLTREEAEIYLIDRRARGFNTLLVNLIEHKYARKAPGNIYGEEPFTLPGNFGQPNEAYFKHADWVLARAKALGFLVLLTPAYIGYGGGDDGWWQEMLDNSVDTLRGYGRYLGNRYGHLDNIVWVNGGDYDPPNKSLVVAIADGIEGAAPQQLQTGHFAPETVVPDFWGDASRLDIMSVYTYKPVCERVAAAYRHPDVRPVYLIESAYENEHGAGPERVRRQAYQALLCGASGHIYGNNPIWHFHHAGLHDAPTGWWQALGSGGAQGMTHLFDLFSSLPWWTLQPDLDGRLVADRGEGDERVTAALSADGYLAVIYVPARQTIRVDLGRLKGQAMTASWFDPASGETSELPAPASPAEGTQEFSPPGRNADGDGDWILLLRAASEKS